MNEPFEFAVRAWHVGRRLRHSLTTNYVRFAENALRDRLTIAAGVHAVPALLEAALAASLPRGVLRGRCGSNAAQNKMILRRSRS